MCDRVSTVVSEGKGPRGLTPPNFFQYLIFNKISKPKLNKITMIMFWNTPQKKMSGYGLADES